MSNQAGTFSAQLHRLQEQIEALASTAAPAAADAQEKAPLIQDKLADYVRLAAEFAPQVAAVVRQFLSKNVDAAASSVQKAAVPTRRTYRTGAIAIGMVLVGAGLVVYGVRSGALAALIQRRPAKA